MIETILDFFPVARSPRVVRELGNRGGFSGAALWRVETSIGPLCLRRWPPGHPSHDHLRWIHRVLQHVAQGPDGDPAASVQQAVAPHIDWIPVPYPLERSGGSSVPETFLDWGGHLWELTPWLEGSADYREHPSSAKLTAALRTLAMFHQRAISPSDPVVCGISPGWKERMTFVERTLRDDLGNDLARWHAKLRGRGNRSPWGWETWCWHILNLLAPELPQLQHDLSAHANPSIPLQPVLRDIWHDHVLFQGDRVSGIVDFGAMRRDSVVGDLARLLGSLVGNDREGWIEGMAAYQSIAPLSPIELQLLPLWDRANLLLSGLHWIRWLVDEGRTFDDPAAVCHRLAAIHGRLMTAPPAGDHWRSVGA